MTKIYRAVHCFDRKEWTESLHLRMKRCRFRRCLSFGWADSERNGEEKSEKQLAIGVGCEGGRI